MDIKTLEYMGKRVDKARKLKQDIEEVDSKIDFINKRNGQGYEVRFGFPNGGACYLDKGHAGTDVIITEVIAFTIIALTNYRDKLQKELDEL